MSKAVWVYSLSEEKTTEYQIKVPKKSALLTMQLRRGDPALWFLVDKEEQEYETRIFLIKGTGWDVEEGLNYIGTFQLRDGLLVFHVFEKVRE